MYEQLTIFRNERGLQYSPGNITANITQEAAEALIEIEKDNELGTICELCDFAIYVINGLEAMGHDAKSNIERSAINAMLPDDPTPTQAVSLTYMALSHWLLKKEVQALALIAHIAMMTIESMGYCAESCIREKAKCINSRKGAYDDELKKWMKDKHQDKSELYQPRYAECKR